MPTSCKEDQRYHVTMNVILGMMESAGSETLKFLSSSKHSYNTQLLMSSFF
jgi:hypothetical protein